MAWDSSDHSDYRVVDCTGWKNLELYPVLPSLTTLSSLFYSD
jgi:hypothetical protein